MLAPLDGEQPQRVYSVGGNNPFAPAGSTLQANAAAPNTAEDSDQWVDDEQEEESGGLFSWLPWNKKDREVSERFYDDNGERPSAVASSDPQYDSYELSERELEVAREAQQIASMSRNSWQGVDRRGPEQANAGQLELRPLTSSAGTGSAGLSASEGQQTAAPAVQSVQAESDQQVLNEAQAILAQLEEQQEGDTVAGAAAEQQQQPRSEPTTSSDVPAAQPDAAPQNSANTATGSEPPAAPKNQAQAEQTQTDDGSARSPELQLGNSEDFREAEQVATPEKPTAGLELTE